MTDLWYIILAFLFSTIVSWCIIPQVIQISFKKRLFDIIDGRTVHKGNIPRLGGVAFTPALVISVALVFLLSELLNSPIKGIAGNYVQIALFFLSLLLIYFSGVIDDLKGLGYKKKFLAQFISAGIIVFSGVWLDNLYGLFGIYALPWYVGQPLSVLLIVYIMNALNLIDGIDGLASGISITILFFLGSLFKIIGNIPYTIITFSMLGAIQPFFFYNVFGSEKRHSKIFMGDCGSLVLGLTIGLLTIRLAMYENITFENCDKNAIIAFSALMIPCFDVIRVMAGRILRNTNPFLPDKTHIHHRFLSIGFSQTRTLVVILMLEVGFILLNMALVDKLNINVLFILNVLLYAVIQIWITLVIRHQTEKN